LALHVPTPATTLLQLDGVWLTFSSMKLSQSLSAPSQISAAGVFAEQPTQPELGLQVSDPKQVPLALFFAQVRVAPLFDGRHVQVPESGTHWSGPPAMAAQPKPASHCPAGRLWLLPSEQSRPQIFSPPLSVTQRSPGVPQSPSTLQLSQVFSLTGVQDSGPDFQ